MKRGELKHAAAFLRYGGRARAWHSHPDTADMSSLRRRAGQLACAGVSMALSVGCACLSQIQDAIACIGLQGCMGTRGTRAHVRGPARAGMNGCMASLLSLGNSC